MGYKSRLAGDLDRWIDRGWIAPERRQDILGDIPEPARRWTAIGALAILGAALLAMSALTFVAANWDAMPRLLRFALIVLALWLSLASGGHALDRGFTAPGHALALLGAALFGAAILLTAQTFNMASFRNTAVLIWTAAALATALAIPSRPVLILATLLGALWAALEIFNPFVGGLVWGYLPLWAITAGLAFRLGSKVSMHLLALGLVLWVGHALHEYAVATGATDLAIHAGATLIFGALALAGALARDRGVGGGGIFAAWMATATALLALLLQLQIGEARNAAPAGRDYILLAGPAGGTILALLAARAMLGRCARLRWRASRPSGLSSSLYRSSRTRLATTGPG